MAQQPDIGPWPPLSSPSIRRLIPCFEILIFFTVRSRQPLAQPPTWRTRLSVLVWIIPFDLSGMGGPTSSYATAGIALRVIWPHKAHHYVKVETPSWGLHNMVYKISTCILCKLLSIPDPVSKIIPTVFNIRLLNKFGNIVAIDISSCSTQKFRTEICSLLLFLLFTCVI
jgi:hypothetical protein